MFPPKPAAGAGKPEAAAGWMVPKVPVEAWEERPRVGGPAALGRGGEWGCEVRGGGERCKRGERWRRCATC